MAAFFADHSGLRQFVSKLAGVVPYGDRMKIMVKRAFTEHGAHLPGHYYSPVPSRTEVLSRLGTTFPVLQDLDLNRDEQFALLQSLAPFYPEVDFPHFPQPNRRYYYDNNFFTYADAIFLSCLLRRYRPKRIIEIGSGHSSAVMLDTIDDLPGYKPSVAFVEPYPERLYGVLKKEDRNLYQIIEKPLAAVEASLFGELGSGDLLFVDSSHVVKYGSDVQRLFFGILPLLRPGVIVHFHDIFKDFEYPDEWLRNGAYFNEAYLLRAFLSHNSDWKILFFEADILEQFKDYIAVAFPRVNSGHGSSMYLQKIGSCGL
ncbi:MAG: class I SAM-dependent methyltransferase [Cyanobacteriota bacterium]